jgi:hypothetical protein
MVEGKQSFGYETVGCDEELRFVAPLDARSLPDQIFVLEF